MDLTAVYCCVSLTVVGCCGLHPLSPPLQDLIIFPEDCEFKRVSQVTTGRVYVLRFKAGSKRLFFWMQVSGGV